MKHHIIKTKIDITTHTARQFHLSTVHQIYDKIQGISRTKLENTNTNTNRHHQ